jgi:hypothetical protein
MDQHLRKQTLPRLLIPSSRGLPPVVALRGTRPAKPQFRNPLSFMRCLGLGLADAVPDANTIWTFREALRRATLNGARRLRCCLKPLR